MKLPPQRIAAFLKAPDKEIRAALVYGPDAGLVRERAQLLAAAICADLNDAFRVSELDSGTLAGDLSPRSSLRRAFEAARPAAAIACYLDGPREIAELARAMLGAHKIELRSEAIPYLTAHLGGDRELTRRELEKLALYVGDGGKAGEAEVTAVIGDSAELSADEVAFAAAEGDAAQLERALNRAFGEGAQPVTVLRAELRHFQRLHLAGSRLAAGASEDEALKLRPPLFFKLV